MSGQLDTRMSKGATKTRTNAHRKATQTISTIPENPPFENKRAIIMKHFVRGAH